MITKEKNLIHGSERRENRMNQVSADRIELALYKDKKNCRNIVGVSTVATLRDKMDVLAEILHTIRTSGGQVLDLDNY